MMKRVPIAFHGGMNQDDDNKLIPQGDYRLLKNLRSGVSVAGKMGMAESIQSTYKIPVSVGHLNGDSKLVGKAVDPNNDKIYYIFANPSFYDVILEHDIKTDAVALVMDDDRHLLYLDPDYLVYNAFVIDGKLVFTDDKNQPFLIDISKAKQYLLNDFDMVSTITNWSDELSYDPGDIVAHGAHFYRCILTTTTQEPPDVTYWTELSKIEDSYWAPMAIADILFIATPPINPPPCFYYSTRKQKSNNLRGNLYQFAYRYIYSDYRKSTFGPISTVPIPIGEEQVNGIANIDVSINNTIKVSFNTGPAEVIMIEVIFRSTKDVSTWYKAHTCYKYSQYGNRTYFDNSNPWFDFFDDISLIAIAEDEAYAPYHYVPQKAGFVEIIEGNNVVFADVTEGYDSFRPNITIEKSLHDISLETAIINMGVHRHVHYEHAILGKTKTVQQWYVSLPNKPYVGCTYKLRTYHSIQGEKIVSYMMQEADEPTYPASVKNALIALADTEGMYREACLTYPNDQYDICFLTLTRVAYSEFDNLDAQYDYIEWDLSGWIEDPIAGDEPLIPRYRILKAGASHGFGMVYYDGERRCGSVITDDICHVYLDYYNDDRGSGLLTNSKRWRVNMIINHLPPTGATHYHIVYTGNLSMSFWIQMKISTLTVQGDYLEININQEIDDLKEEFRNFDVSPYVFETGDRMRVVAKIDTGVIVEYGTFIDIDIIGTDPDNENIIRVNRFDNDDFLNTDCIIEIYRPSRISEESVYYEIGLKHSISVDGYGNRYHEEDVDQILDAYGYNSSGAEVYCEDYAHDSYKHVRLTTEDVIFWAEDSNLSDYFRPTDLVSKGWPKVIDSNLTQAKMTNRLRWGGSLQIGTRNNQISNFAYDGYDDLPERYGPINGVFEVGFVLKVLQAHKVWSFYIRRIATFNADGSEDMIFTNKIFGTKRPMSQEWGTQNPESVVVHERNMYFFDKIAGRMIRDSANGFFPISDYKMYTFFQSIGMTYKNDAGLRCFTGINETFSEVWFHFRNDAGHLFTIVFNELKNRWTNMVEDFVDRYINFGNFFIGVETYQIWLYNHDYVLAGPYNRFQERSPAHPEFIVVANPDPLQVKLWKTIIEHSSHKFYNTLNGITIPANDNYGDGMETRLRSELIKSKEGVYYGPVMRDYNTPPVPSSGNIVNGRPMRGHILIINLLDLSYSAEFISIDFLEIVYNESKI